MSDNKRDNDFLSLTFTWFHSFLCNFKSSGFPDCRRLPAVSCKSASRPMGGGCKTGTLPSCGGKDPRRPDWRVTARFDLRQQGLQSFVPHAFAWFTRQIEYLRQPDEPGLRAYPLSGLRIGFSLQRGRFPVPRLCVRSLSGGLLNGINISGNWLSCASRRLDPVVLRTAVSRRVRFQISSTLSRARTTSLHQSAQFLMMLPAHYRPPAAGLRCPRAGACAPLYCHAFALLSHPLCYILCVRPGSRRFGHSVVVDRQ